MSEALVTLREATLSPQHQEALKTARPFMYEPDVRGVFEAADAEKWSETDLAGALVEILTQKGVDPNGVVGAAAFLAQEHRARDLTKTLLVDPETGLPVAQVSPDDIYRPESVERFEKDENGALVSLGMSAPSLQLKPEVAAAITLASYAQGKERDTLTALTARVKQTELVKQNGDPRLLVATKKGRRQLEEKLRTNWRSMFEVDGRSRTDLFIEKVRFSRGIEGQRLNLIANHIVSLKDLLSINLRHDVFTAMVGSLRNSLVRKLACQAANLAYVVLDAKPCRMADIAGEGLLVAEPDVCLALGGARDCLPSEHAATVLFLNGPDVELHEESFDLLGVEYNQNWSVTCSVDVSIHIPLTGVIPYVLTDVPEVDNLVEVV